MLTGLLVDLEPFTREFLDEKMGEFWNNESRQWATMGDAGPITRAELKRINEHRAGARERGYTGVRFMLRAKDGNIIGDIGINWISNVNRTASLGSWIGDPTYWSGGHGTDGLLLLVEYAFDWLDMRRLTLSTMDINIRAQRNVERCGFVLEARRREESFFDGQPVDELSYGMLREEWRGREALVSELGLRERAAQRYGAAE